jgi:CRISPR system Cascade subunit CasE
VLISANVGADQIVSGLLYRENQKFDLQYVSVLFDGVLQVIDPAQMLEALRKGIGSGKGMGFGLLSLAPYYG